VKTNIYRGKKNAYGDSEFALSEVHSEWKLPDSSIFTFHFRIRCFYSTFFQNTSALFTVACGVARCCAYCRNRSLLELLAFVMDFAVVFVTAVFGCFPKAVC